ncbi:conserved membrane protein with BTB/POZ domain [Scheffersomyces stipitis CBS 6054]|uniref:Conserved membrane protein with BTB/POZ domain n=1 Tax=Scheffersomyces stipitis (strain ATCC 58785 / CBS 6054 / NBRC 10063 / NRRL Y-11545) TaxID=322104 RepID=A3LWG3_PICST|nr:conserved membrane protein with BTB/POZ domain [Scheffersomyces stipitis CBS 6054]ABN67272.2 conserved membrane protein with BTB/POZ domain [Scheffersomyces stipitis CBS 6054]
MSVAAPRAIADIPGHDVSVRPEDRERGFEENGDSPDLQSKKVFSDLCMACRRGDLEAVDALLSTPNLDINQVDEFDYSPLILSSLCGHLPVVELLLSRGAICDRDTFEGARCIYGALTDEIRDLLISFDISKAVDTKQSFATDISNLISARTGAPTRDIVFYFPHVHGVLSRGYQSFRLHRFLLAARSIYFQEKLAGEWASSVAVELPSSIDPIAFRIVVDFIYFKANSLPTEDIDLQDKLIDLAEQFALYDLAEGVKRIQDSTKERERSKIKYDLAFKFSEEGRRDLDRFLNRHIISDKIVTRLTLEDDIDFEDIQVAEIITRDQKKKLMGSASFPDIILSAIDADTESVVFYPVHKSIISRSEYFDTMLKSEIFINEHKELPYFKSYEKSSNLEVINRPQFQPDHLPVIQISNSSASQDVAEMVLCYLYHDDIPNIPLLLAVDLLFASDELFLDRLKTICSVRIASSFDKFTPGDFDSLKPLVGYDAYDLVRVSWEARSDKLEQHVTKMIAYNLENIFKNDVQKELLATLVNESASRIQERQDTDTIELIDDIRYYLQKKYAVSDEYDDLDPGLQFRDQDERDDIRIYKNAVANFNRDIEMIDHILDGLQLDA